jgi:hypothetical protein
MENGETKNGLNKGLWRVMESNIRDVSEVPTMKSLDQPKKEEKAEKKPADFECASNTCPSQEVCKAAQEALCRDDG